MKCWQWVIVCASKPKRLVGLLFWYSLLLVNAHAEALEVTLTLHEQVSLNHSTVYFADVADIAGAPVALATQLGDISLGHAPLVSNIDHFVRAALESRLRRSGLIDDVHLHWRGAQAVFVHTRGQAIPESDIMLALSQFLQKYNGGTQSDSFEVSSLHPWHAGEAPLGKLSYEVRLGRQVALSAAMSIWVDVYVDGSLYRTVVVPIALSAIRSVAIARHSLVVGDLVTDADFMWREENVFSGIRMPLVRDKLVPGQRVRRNVKADAIVTEADLVSSSTVLPGDAIILKEHVAGLTVQRSLVALSEAGPGQRLVLTTTAGDQRYQARVRASGDVELLERGQQ